ncbi:uncharacterized protein LOC112565968 [Pomacea canaliculata]|uniref:uncharacterized protein LOC112565968 n=1 Tax=Pomacea canaliculata TaxID=400727 RepID=UPI000D726E63|nr:uncharacterized protein LOC112565968 [Pomacea canaliculata]
MKFWTLLCVLFSMTSLLFVVQVLSKNSYLKTQTTMNSYFNSAVNVDGANFPPISTSWSNEQNTVGLGDDKGVNSEQTYDLIFDVSTEAFYKKNEVLDLGPENTTSLSSKVLEPSHQVVLTSKTFTECLNSSHYLTFSTQNVVTNIKTKASDKLPRLSSCKIQVTAPASTIFYINVISINVQCTSFQLVLTDVGATSRRLINSCDNDIPSELWSFTNVVVMTFLVSLESQVIQVALNFTAVPATQRPQLEILFTSSTRGYIQTPSWDGHKRYPVLMDSWVKVDVPEQSAIMVSLPHIDIEGDSPFYCPGDGVELYVIETLNQSSWTRCKSKLVPPTLYQTRALLVHFYSNEYGSNTGFRLLFSIHNQSSLPVELADGRWNCSGLNWTDFSSHFSCNLRSDCVGSEDEAICPYTSDRCGVGQPFFENSCYIWQKPSPVMTWKEAFDFCLSRGARLASLNTPAEWNNAISLMSLADYTVVFVGMLQMFLQRQMYLNAFQWTDGTIAYFKTINGYATMPACGFFVFDALLLGIKLKDCSEPRQAHVLCETEAHPGTHLPSEHKNDKLMITQVAPSAWQKDSSKVVCPEGHVTQTFLSCDVASSCWRRASSSFCDAPLAVLSPVFDCDNGFDRVPYTLVCDHRIDCSDGSDENFCQFASCYISNKYDCGNQQVTIHNSSSFSLSLSLTHTHTISSISYS